MPFIGHYAIQFAKALGSQVVVFSHSPNKEVCRELVEAESDLIFFFQKDAKDLGTDEFVVTKEGFTNSLQDKLDLIIVRAIFLHWPTDSRRNEVYYRRL